VRRWSTWNDTVTDRDGANASALVDTVATPIPPGLPGSMIADRYVLGARIGRGGMADVYVAEDQLLGRSVAIKVFRVDATPDERRRIDGETRTLAALRNPGLVTVFDAGALPGVADESTPYLVMELITGPTLASLLRDGPLAATDAARMGRELADTLAYVHANSIVHRDVKPANILLDTEHSGSAPYTVKLADFGISRVTNGARITRHGTTVGTPNYLSPEQAQGLEISPASDIYSLGLVLIECLTGRVVYPGSGIDAAIARLRHPPVIPAGSGRQWQQLLAAMTESDPSNRPASTDAAATLAVLQDGPVHIEQISSTADTAMLSDLTPASTAVLPTAEVGIGTRRVTRLLALAAGIAVALIVIAIVALSGGGSTTTPPKPAYPTVSGQLGADLTKLEGAVP
jgi:serine/threonine protein kinase